MTCGCRRGASTFTSSSSIDGSRFGSRRLTTQGAEFQDTRNTSADPPLPMDLPLANSGTTSISGAANSGSAEGRRGTVAGGGGWPPAGCSRPTTGDPGAILAAPFAAPLAAPLAAPFSATLWGPGLDAAARPPEEPCLTAGGVLAAATALAGAAAAGGGRAAAMADRGTPTSAAYS